MGYDVLIEIINAICIYCAPQFERISQDNNPVGLTPEAERSTQD